MKAGSLAHTPVNLTSQKQLTNGGKPSEMVNAEVQFLTAGSSSVQLEINVAKKGASEADYLVGRVELCLGAP